MPEMPGSGPWGKQRSMMGGGEPTVMPPSMRGGLAPVPLGAAGPGGMGLPLPPGFAERTKYDTMDVKRTIASYGRESFPVDPEWPQYDTSYWPDQGGEPGQHPLDDEPGFQRTIVRLPHPRFRGGHEFVDSVRKSDAMFAWSEICATPEPECSLAPVPQVPMKSWYNSYVYVPEKKSHRPRQFLERFVPGPDGEWLDVVKARRMSSFFVEHRAKAQMESEERNMVKSGSIVDATNYTDAYTTEHLVACHGQLIPKAELLDRYNIHHSEWSKNVQDIGEMWDFDNLRTPWPFGRFDRNKKVSAHAYEWFDRRNTFIPSDRSYEMLELPSIYVDREMYSKWRASGGPGVPEYVHDVRKRAQYPVDDYPYQL